MTGELYRHFAADGRLLYVGVSVSAIARLADHRYAAPWFSAIARVEIARYPTRADALDAERKAIREERPAHNLASGVTPKREFVLGRGTLRRLGHWPAGMYVVERKGKTHYRWQHPETGKTQRIGRARSTAIGTARMLNEELALAAFRKTIA